MSKKQWLYKHGWIFGATYSALYDALVLRSKLVRDIILAICTISVHIYIELSGRHL